MTRYVGMENKSPRGAVCAAQNTREETMTKYRIIKGEDRGSYLVCFGESDYRGFNGGNADCLRFVREVLRREYDTYYDLGTEKIPIWHEDKETGELKRFFVPKTVLVKAAHK